MGDNFKTDLVITAGAACTTAMFGSFWSGLADPTTKKGWKYALGACAFNAVSQASTYTAIRGLEHISQLGIEDSRDIALKVSLGTVGAQFLASIGNGIATRRNLYDNKLVNGILLPLNIASAPASSLIGFGKLGLDKIRYSQTNLTVFGGMVVLRGDLSCSGAGGQSLGTYITLCEADASNRLVLHEVGHGIHTALIGDFSRILYIKPFINGFIEPWADHYAEVVEEHLEFEIPLVVNM